MRKYKIIITYQQGKNLYAEILTANNFLEALTLRNILLKCKNVAHVGQPIVWFGADGQSNNQKLLKTWPNCR